MTEAKQYWLYVLKLNEGKYYVGITSKHDPNARIKEHANGFYTAQWVKKYGMIEPVEVERLGIMFKGDAERLELKRTLEYMRKYGYQNVRGGKLNYSGKYRKIGNRFFRDEDFNLMSAILFMMAVLLLLIFTRK